MMTPIWEQNIEELSNTVSELLAMGHYLRVEVPLLWLWVRGGIPLMESLSAQAMSTYEKDNQQVDSLMLAVQYAAWASMNTWDTGIARLQIQAPDHPFTHLQLARYRLFSIDATSAKTSYDRTIALAPANSDVQAIGADFYGTALHLAEQSLVTLNRLIANHPDVDYYYVARSAIYQHELKDYPTALRDINRAIALSPGHYPFYNMRAQIYIAAGDYRASLLDLEFALHANPNSPNAISSFLESALFVGETQPAAAALLTPRSSLFNRGELIENQPTIVTFKDFSTAFYFSIHTDVLARITITAVASDAKQVAPFIALIDPAGIVIAHSSLHNDPTTLPPASIELQVHLPSPGDYSLYAGMNRSWLSTGEGDLSVSFACRQDNIHSGSMQVPIRTTPSKGERAR